jgi:hypothetical protein
MSTPTVDLPAHVIGGPAPAVTMTGPNQRIRTRAGMLGTVAGVLTFGHGGSGAWIAGNTRTRAGGVFLVSTTATGTCVVPGSPPVTAPVSVSGGNPSVRSA